MIAFRSMKTANSTGLTLTLARPLQTKENDLLIAVIGTRTVQTITPPAGWTQLDKLDVSVANGFSGNEESGAIFYRFATASEPATHVFTCGVNEEHVGIIAAYSGVDTTYPIDSHDIGTGTVPSFNASPPVTYVFGSVEDGPATHTSTFGTERGDLTGTNAAASLYDFGIVGSSTTGVPVITTGGFGFSIFFALVLRPRRSFTDLQNEVLAHGFEETAYRARVASWLNDAFRRIGRRMKLPSEDVTYSFSTVAGTASYGLPGSLLRLSTVRRTDLDPDAELSALELEDIEDQPVASGQPAYYALSGQNIVLWPTPDRAYPIVLRYRKGSARMVADDDPTTVFPEEYLQVAVNYALWKAYLSEDDADFANAHHAEYMSGLQELAADLPYRRRIPRQVPGMWNPPSAPTFRRP